jgi:hypothetical protein
MNRSFFGLTKTNKHCEWVTKDLILRFCTSVLFFCTSLYIEFEQRQRSAAMPARFAELPRAQPYPLLSEVGGMTSSFHEFPAASLFTRGAPGCEERGGGKRAVS